MSASVGNSGASLQPHTTTSASPARRIRKPSASDCAPAAHAVPIDELYPRSPCLMAIRAAPMLGSMPGNRYGLTPSRPRWVRVTTCASSVASPPVPDTTHATRSGSTSVPTVRPASAIARSAARIAITMYRSSTRASVAGTTLAGSIAGPTPATSSDPAAGCPSGGLRNPDGPWHNASNTSPRCSPTGVTNPIPVTTQAGRLMTAPPHGVAA